MSQKLNPELRTDALAGLATFSAALDRMVEEYGEVVPDDDVANAFRDAHRRLMAIGARLGGVPIPVQPVGDGTLASTPEATQTPDRERLRELAVALKRAVRSDDEPRPSSTEVDRLADGTIEALDSLERYDVAFRHLRDRQTVVVLTTRDHPTRPLVITAPHLSLAEEADLVGRIYARYWTASHRAWLSTHGWVAVVRLLLGDVLAMAEAGEKIDPDTARSILDVIGAPGDELSLPIGDLVAAALEGREQIFALVRGLDESPVGGGVAPFGALRDAEPVLRRLADALGEVNGDPDSVEPREVAPGGEDGS